jgi:hypothetical protein
MKDTIDHTLRLLELLALDLERIKQAAPWAAELLDFDEQRLRLSNRLRWIREQSPPVSARTFEDWAEGLCLALDSQESECEYRDVPRERRVELLRYWLRTAPSVPASEKEVAQ